jgi:hypothetical protein
MFVAIMPKVFVVVSLLIFYLFSVNASLVFETRGQDCPKCHTLSNDEARDLLKDIIPNTKYLRFDQVQSKVSGKST